MPACEKDDAVQRRLGSKRRIAFLSKLFKLTDVKPIIRDMGAVGLGFSRVAAVLALAIVAVSNAAAGTNAIYEWTFDGGTLSPSLGRGTITFSDGATAGVTTFGITGGSVPHIGGQAATYMHVPVLNAAEDGYLMTLPDTGPNGGGSYLNQYTLIMDVLLPGARNWTALFNTAPDNSNDADWYVAPDGSLGIASLGYTDVEVVAADTWYRLTFSADLGAGIVTYYKNGTPVYQRTGSSLLDGRYALYTTNDNLPSLLLFNEGDASGNYTHELYVAGIAFVDRMLSPAEVAGLGAPNAEGIFVRRLNPRRNGSDIEMTWSGAPTLRLQRTPNLFPPNWQDIPGTLGGSSFGEPLSTGAFYRLAWE